MWACSTLDALQNHYSINRFFVLRAGALVVLCTLQGSCELDLVHIFTRLARTLSEEEVKRERERERALCLGEEEREARPNACRPCVTPKPLPCVGRQGCSWPETFATISGAPLARGEGWPSPVLAQEKKERDCERLYCTGDQL